jgi:hypothetical protein
MTEHVTRDPPESVGTSAVPFWWRLYADSLSESSISPTSREVIEADSRFITSFGVLGAGDAGDDRWPDGRIRRGLVMGSVQSGKTASMLGVAALSLDAGVDMILVLAGTRVSLWLQTLDRLLQQLDTAVGSPAERAQRRILIPIPGSNYYEDDRSPSTLYAVNRATLRRSVATRRPIIAVVMKNVHHLRAMASIIHERLIPAVDQARRPFHLLVLDDEADDGSILDARIEQGLDPSLRELKQIPRSIVDLWEARPHTSETASSHLFTTYVGYTATPQANFLQSDHNPLAPTDFALAIRTPYDVGEPLPRSTTYREPNGLGAFYVGGESFYGRLRDADLCQSVATANNDTIAEAVRAFLVAGAIRVWRRGDRLLPSEADATRFATRADAVARSPEPHSMLFHPSAAISDHFDAAVGVLEATCGLDRSTSVRLIQEGDRGLPVDATVAMIARDETLWARWLDRFSLSAEAVQAAFDLPRAPRVPRASDWPEIRSFLIDEVIPFTRIKVVNSDPHADERPAFAPTQDDTGAWRAPADRSTIFVSGNVMSRGLTLEGLTTTLFLRQSDDPYADTQMQMQRWFGYRGEYLDLCRVFTPGPQLELFRAYHDADEALRRVIVQGMNDIETDPGRPLVLQGRDFSATGKLTNIANVPLCPGAAPFIRSVNSGVTPDPNAELIAQAFGTPPSRDVVVKGLVRGRALEEPLTLTQAAELLDGLRYEGHRPTTDGWEGQRWMEMEAKVGIDHASDVDHLLPFFRPPRVSIDESTPYLRGGPYAISAYLRLWKACLTRHARGLVATDNPRTPWSMVDLVRKSAEQPHFWVGIRYGSGADVSEGPLGDLPFTVRTMRRAVIDGRLEAAWGTRNPAGGADDYLGDELFDYHIHGELPPTAPSGEPMWRPTGAPGLILFHVVEQPDREFPTAAVGVALPIGGPDQFAARPPMTSTTRPAT